MERGDTASTGRFYDALRSHGFSSAALGHGDAYIGQECLLSAEEIAGFAQRAGITAGTSVLDIGSGTGGPACYLARRFGCRVEGVDVSAVGHAQAEARAREAGLTHLVEFRLGDIEAVAPPAAGFDVIISLDVWCHIPERGGLLRRCADLLRPGGRVALYDHVRRTHWPEEEYQRFCDLWRFAGLETPQSYLDAVQAAGFRVLHHEETSEYAVRFYGRLVEGFPAKRAEIEALRGPARYQEGLERLQFSERLAISGMLGQFGCIAETLAGAAS